MAIKAGDQITIVDVTDAYSVILTSESYTFVGGTSGATSGKCITEVVAFCGSNQITEVTVGDIICPPGISASIEGSGTPKVTITFNITSTLSTSCEATIPVHVDGIEINKKFSFAVAKSGTSVTVSSTSVTYQAGDSGITAPTGEWKESVPSVANGQYLWTKTYVEYSDGNKTTSYSVSYKGTNGTNGSNGTSVTVSSTSVTYQASDSGTTTPTGEWKESVPSVANGQYLWTKTLVTYSDGAKTEAYSVSYKGTNGTNGKDGAAGADAITITITTSNGTVFKNNTGTTVLTAHVYKGGVEQSITDAGVCGSLGSVKWYNGSGTQPAGWPKTSKTITAGASIGSGIDVVVSNVTAITCQLEN